LNIIVDKR